MGRQQKEPEASSEELALNNSNKINVLQPSEYNEKGVHSDINK